MRAAGVADSVRLPPDDRSPANTRSLAAFERAFRRVSMPLQSVWIASRFTPERPTPLVAVMRLQVASDGAVSVVGLRGNVPDGLPADIARHVTETGVRLPAAPSPFEAEFAVVVEPL